MKKGFLKSLILVFVLIFGITVLIACNDKSTDENIDTPSDPGTPNDPTVPTVPMTESYAKGRAEFKAVTGIELPALENITVEEFPYEEGATSYELDITENVTKATFDTIVAFLDNKLSAWTKEGPTTEGDYTNIWYRNNTGSIGITWDDHNKAVYVHAIMSGNQPTQPAIEMTESYANGRESFHTIMEIWLPEWEECEDVFSWFDMNNQSLRFDFSGSADLLSALSAYLTDEIGQPLRDGFWEYNDTVNGKEAKVNVEIGYYTKDKQYVISIHGEVRNYYTVTLTAGTGGSATLKMGSRTFDNNVAKVNAGDHLIFTATPDDNYEFVGWYDGETLISEDNPYSPYQAPAKNSTIQGRFEELPTMQMTDSYAAARSSFQSATGLLLPELASVNGYYMSADKEIDIGGSTVENGATSNTLATVNTALQNQINVDPTTSNGITTWTYTKTINNVIYDCTVTSMFQNEGNGGLVVVHYSEQVQEPETNMTDSYKTGRNNFYAISGIWLPELEDIDLDDDSSFNTEKKEAQFVVASNADVFTSIVNTVKAALEDEPLSDNNNHWEEEGWMAFWEWDYEDGGRMHKVTIQLENNTYKGKITVGYWFRDYYTLTLTAGEGGSATLEIAGRGQDGNTAHVVYNTYSELTATPSLGYEFVGFYDGNTKLSENNPYGYMIVKDITIEARFQEKESNMDAGYKAARKALYDMSGIVLPEAENITINEDHSYINVDTENGVRDEYQYVFVFATEDEALAAYDEFKAAIILIDGDPEESMEGMDLWSVLYPDNTIPYRDDVMMHIDATNIFLMWRKQPIIFYYVESEGNGTAYISYTGSDYQERQTNNYWEIADAFHGKVVAVPDGNAEFSGWYVNNELVSTEATYNFSYYNQTVDFTEITFVAKFE